MPKKPCVALIAYDVGPSLALERLRRYLAARGDFTVQALLAEGGRGGVPVLEHVLSVADRADIVLCGISSEKNARIELAAVQDALVHEGRKLVGLFADTHGAWTREHFGKFRDSINFLFVVSEEEKQAAGERFSRADIFVTGNPLWADFFKPADSTAVRRRLGADQHDFVIFAPGTKTADFNVNVWQAAIQAVSACREHGLLVLGLHPGDKTDIGIYAELRKRAADLRVQCVLTRKDSSGLSEENAKLIDHFIDGDALVPASDVIINGISLRVHAIARRKPVIDYYEPLGQAWLRRDTGSDCSYFAEHTNAVMPIYGLSWQQLRAAIDEIQRIPAKLLRYQERAVPGLSEEQVLAKMAYGLDWLLSAHALL